MTELLQSWTWCSGHCWIPKPNVELRQVHLLWTWLLIQLPPVVGASNMPCWTSWCSCCPAALAVGPCSLWTRTGSSVHCWSWSGPQCSGKRLLLQPALGSCWESPCQNSAWVLTHWSPWSVLLPHPSWLRGVLLWCKATTFPCRCCRSRRGMPVVPGMLRWQPMRAWWLVLSIRLLSKTTLLAFWWLALWSRRCWSTTLCWFPRRCWSSQFELLRNHCGCGNENENVEAGCCQQKMLTFKNCTNHSVEFFHLLDLKLGKKRENMLCITDMLYGTCTCSSSCGAHSCWSSTFRKSRWNTWWDIVLIYSMM